MMSSKSNRNDPHLDEHRLSALLSLLDKAKELDNGVFAKDTGSSALTRRPSSFDSLSSQASPQLVLQAVASPQHHANVQHTGLPAIELPTQQSSLGKEDVALQETTKDEPETSRPLPNNEEEQSGQQSLSLEDYEAKAFNQLAKKGLKRPAAAHPPAVLKRPSAKPKASASKACQPEIKTRLTCWGCTRCRGNVHGCDSCNFDSFQGTRLNGRSAWEKYMKDKKTKSGKGKKL